MRGRRSESLFLQWNGTTWVQVPGDDSGPTGLGFSVKAVSAVSVSDIWSVGSNSHTLAEHWNGTAWSIASTPNTGDRRQCTEQREWECLNRCLGGGLLHIWDREAHPR
jgi:hypothetical protein